MALAAEEAPVEQLGAYIRRLRVERGLTQQEVATPRMSRGFLAAVETGTRSPGDEALLHIAGRLSVDLDDLRHRRPVGLAGQLRERLREARRRLSHGGVDYALGEFGAIRVAAGRYGLPELAGWAAYQLGEVELHRGLTATAAARFAEAAAEVPEGCQQLRAAVTARQASCALAAGDAPRAVAMLERELRVLRSGPSLDTDAELRLISGLLYAFVVLDWRGRAAGLEREARALLPGVTNQEWLAQFCVTAAQLRREPGDLDEVRRLLGEAERLYRELDFECEIGMCHWARGYVLRLVDRLPEAEAEFRAARAILGKVGTVQYLAGATVELAEVLRRQGALDEAAALAREAADSTVVTGHRECAAEADRVLGLIAWARDRLDEAERRLSQAADGYEVAGLTAELTVTCGALGDLLLEQGRLEDATTVLRRGLRGAEKLW